MSVAVLAGIIVVAVLVVMLLFRVVWRVAEPNQALIISGLGAHGVNGDTAESLGFKIVTGKGHHRRPRLPDRPPAVAGHPGRSAAGLLRHQAGPAG
jgi:uncharacterized membrane protein YqiK